MRPAAAAATAATAAASSRAASAAGPSAAAAPAAGAPAGGAPADREKIPSDPAKVLAAIMRMKAQGVDPTPTAAAAFAPFSAGAEPRRGAPLPPFLPPLAALPGGAPGASSREPSDRFISRTSSSCSAGDGPGRCTCTVTS